VTALANAPLVQVRWTTSLRCRLSDLAGVSNPFRCYDFELSTISAISTKSMLGGTP
jgi:hypothetical protein